jgi:arginyl-tRNA synthetase
VRELLQSLLGDALAAARDAGELELAETAPVVVEKPREQGHGDLACNVAMLLARSERKPPRKIAETIAAQISDPRIESVEIAGPGFINVTFSADAWRERLRDILEKGDGFGRVNLGEGRRVQVEFVSANPTGPLHVGHGRGAATGDALARVLEAAGYDVEREYYVNDAGRQMQILGRSVLARYLQAVDENAAFPEEGYPGEYVTEIAGLLREDKGDALEQLPEDESAAIAADYAGDKLLGRIREDLAAFGVSMDNFSSEKQLRGDGTVEAAIQELRDAGHTYEEGGAEWFRSTDFGDDKDRPLVKSGGDLTYFAADVGYHRKKFARGMEKVVDIWGADHHGYVKRVRSALEALGVDPSGLHVVLVQMVNLTRDGVPVRMGKRSGEFVALRDVIDEVGADLARFFFLARKSDAQLEFDLELARRQTAENPVFYIQYAHTRIAGVFRQAEDKGIPLPEATADVLSALQHEDEIALVRVLDDYPNIVESAARSFEPHRVIFYVQALAGDFHRFYSRHRVVSDDKKVTAARLLLVKAVQQVIGNALSLVGISAPSRM